MTENLCPIGLVFWEKDGKTKIWEFWQLWNDGLEIKSREEQTVSGGVLASYKLVDERYLSVVFSKQIAEKQQSNPRGYLNNICDFIGEYLSQLRQSLHSDSEVDRDSDNEEASPLSCRRQNLLGDVFSRISSIEEVKDHLESDPSRKETTYKWLLKADKGGNSSERKVDGDESNIDLSLLTQALTNSDLSPRKQQFQKECAKEYFVPSHKSDKMYDYSKEMVGQLGSVNLLCDFVEKEMALLSEEEITKTTINLKRIQTELRSFREAIRSLSITLNRTLDALNQEIVSAYGSGLNNSEKKEKKPIVEVEKIAAPRVLPRRASMTTDNAHNTKAKSRLIGRSDVADRSLGATGSSAGGAGRGRGRGRGQGLRLSVSAVPGKIAQSEKNPHLSLELLRERDRPFGDRDADSVCSDDKEWRLSMSDYSSVPGSPIGSISSAMTAGTSEKNFKKKYEALKEDLKTRDVMIRNLKTENKKYREEKIAAVNELKVLHGKLDGAGDSKKKKKPGAMVSLNENEAQMTEEEMYTMLQRLKKENKELRKSRNTLQSDHLLLGKIEGKLRYKLEILMKKLSLLQMDLPPSMQKKLPSGTGTGSIEETIDALIEHLTWVSDRCISLENELKSKGGDNGLKVLCQDLKKFALENDLLRKPLKDEDWMPGYQKISVDAAESASNPWQTLFSHMSGTLQKDKDQRKEGLEWIRANTTLTNCDNLISNNGSFVDCFKSVVKCLQNDQSKLQSMNERMGKEQQKMEDELKEVRSSLMKVEDTKKEYQSQMDQLESQMTVLRREKQDLSNNLVQTKEQLELSASKTTMVVKECETAMQTLRDETTQLRKNMQDVSVENEKFKDEIKVMGKQKETMEETFRNLTSERDELKEELSMLRQEKEEMKKELGRISSIETTSIAIQTDPMDLNGMINEEFMHQLKCLTDENTELLSEINRLIQEKSRLNDSTESHKGEVLCMVTSPNEYLACTGGIDYTVRLWKANNSNGLPAFEPCASALVEGKILSLAITRDGRKIACGCSVRDTPNGYVVVWDMASREVLCNLRSRPTQRFGKVSAIAFGNDSWIFAGDITGQIYVYDVTTQQQLAHIHGHKDVLHQLRVLPNNVMISVSHDQWLGQFDLSQLNIALATTSSKNNAVKKPRLEKRASTTSVNAKPSAKNNNSNNNNNTNVYADIKHFQIEYLFKDEKYPLLTSDYFDSKHIVTGSRKLILVPLSKQANNDEEKTGSKGKESNSECFGTDKDLDRIQHLSAYHGKYVMVHRHNLDYVKVFNTTDGSLVCKCDVKQNNIAAIGYSHDGKYAVVCLSNKSSTAGCLPTFAIS